MKIRRKGESSIINKNKYVKGEPVRKVCPQCKKEFLTTNSIKIFCSKDCSKESRIIPGPTKLQIAKVCIKCGNKYTTTSETQIYCGKECSYKVLKDRYIEKRKLSSFQLFERDGFKCVYCGKSSIEDGVKLVIDHIYPVEEGGENDVFNLVTSCYDCNAMKQHKLMNTEIIYRIWKRSYQLSMSMKISFENLKETFNKFTTSRFKYRKKN